MKHTTGNQTKIFSWTVFILLWTYLITRGFTVELFHDEIVTSWIYIVDWNFLPFQGYIDANNHFLNSFLSGLFYQLFDSHHPIVLRLANLLAFPLYYWSVLGFRRFFRHQIAFLSFAILLLATPTIIEFFAMVRGYGLSMAFLIFALLQTSLVLANGSKKHFYLAGAAWVLAVSANLTLIPFAVLGVVGLALFFARKGDWIPSLASLLYLTPIFYFISYSFHLKEIGKLYLGNTNGFLETTIHTLTQFLWWNAHWTIDAVLVALFIVMAATSIALAFRYKTLILPKFVFVGFLVAAIGNIALQRVLLDVNYPVSRAALYLIPFFFGSVAFFLDRFRKPYWNYPVIGVTLIFFVLQFNLSHSNLFKIEHFDAKLITSIPKKVRGTPPSTSGRFWEMQNWETLRNGLTPHFFADMRSNPADTLADYTITRDSICPWIPQYYDTVFTDPISHITLFRIKEFYDRELIFSSEKEIRGTDTYLGTNQAELNGPLLIRVTGMIKNMNPNKKVVLIFSTGGPEGDTYYDGLALNHTVKPDQNGTIHFDMSVALSQIENTQFAKSYLLNPNNLPVEGNLKTEVYKLSKPLP